MTMPKKRHPNELRAQASLRLGGIGAGSIHIYADGRFQNIHIAASKPAAAAGVRAPDSFLALRVATSRGAAVRVICSTWDRAGANMPSAPTRLRWRCVYPAAHFQMDDETFPLGAFWTLFSPVIPFDCEASALPVFFSSIRLVNHGDEPVEAALVFNWDGANAFHGNTSSMKIVPAAIPIQKNLPRSEVHVSHKGEQSGEATEPAYNALVFLQGDSETEQIGDHACLAIRHDPILRLSFLQWDNRAPSAHEQFWTYLTEGIFSRGLHTQGTFPRCGAVIAEYSMQPREEQRADFIFTWHCPSVETADPVTQGAYMARTRNAIETAQKSLRHVRYFFHAIENWQQRLLHSTLPRWMRHALVDSIQAIAANADYTRDGRFCLRASTEGNHLQELDTRIYGSLGLLLFFPRLEDADLAGSIKILQGERGGDETPERLAACLVTAYRNYVFTKNLARLQEFHPILTRATDEVLQGLRPGEHVPESLCTADAAGLWCVAMKAHALMARHLHCEDVAARRDAAYERAIENFNRRFWSKERHCYLSRDDETALDYAGQLSAQWHADYLGLGNIFLHDGILNTLRNAVTQARTPSRPLWELQLACLLLFRGEMEAGLRHAESAWRRIVMSAPHPAQMPTDAMAIWHVLYAMEGLLYNIPDQHLRIAPHLPPGLESLAAPIFTPSCLGQIRFEEESEGHYQQRIKVRLNSLVLLNSIELRTPKTVGDIDVRCVTPDGDAAISVRVLPEDSGNRVLITPHRANVSGPLRLIVTEKTRNP